MGKCELCELCNMITHYLWARRIFCFAYTHQQNWNQPCWRGDVKKWPFWHFVFTFFIFSSSFLHNWKNIFGQAAHKSLMMCLQIELNNFLECLSSTTSDENTREGGSRRWWLSEQFPPHFSEAPMRIRIGFDHPKLARPLLNNNDQK